ncbi:YgfZ/GcvT domain-containing protein [Pleionea sediminis]|uniref:CAF17-like 4Fe-4S cluster assembly/insertion protein YgfZ n=1 Tax=Pleionea sediminis TaxID=2569479 RepID=UPI00118649E1|nr:folate-binding protein YgfZ [Pleionea sediminis]
MREQWQQLIQERLNQEENLSNSSAIKAGDLFDLSSFGVIQLAGEDVIKFLQGQTTNDAQQVTDEKAQLSAICNPQGRMISLFLLLKMNDHWLLILPHTLVEKTINHLKKYGVFFKVDITDLSDKKLVSGLSTDPNNLHLETTTSDDTTLVQWHTDRALLIQSHGAAMVTWQNAKNVHPYTRWLALDIQTGLPRLYAETSEKFLPHNLNLPELNAVSFEKGCYTGQEVVARMHYKGKLKSHLRCLTGEEQAQPEPGDPIYGDGKKIGEVVSATLHNGNLWLLAFCKDSIENTGKIQCDPEKAPILKLKSV